MARRPPLLTVAQRILGRGRAFRAFLTWYPPYLGAGIVVEHVSDDLRRVQVALREHWWNRNYVGTHFGGSLYSMVDPFWMLVLLEALADDDVVVWDKAAHIRFVRPGRGTVRARFALDDTVIADVRARLAAGEDRFDLTLPVSVVDDDEREVARIDKVIHVRTRAFDRQVRARRAAAYSSA